MYLYNSQIFFKYYNCDPIKIDIVIILLFTISIIIMMIKEYIKETKENK